MAERTYEFYGFLQGDPNLVKAGLQVRIYDTNLVEWTDPSETFLTRSTAAGIVYKVRAHGDDRYHNPVDTQTGLRDQQQFYICFQQIGFDPYGRPARDQNGNILTFPFTAGPTNVVNINLFLSFFPFTVAPTAGDYVNRPTISVATSEPNATFLITTGGQEPTINGPGVTTITSSQTYQIAADGLIQLRISGVDLFSNVDISQTYFYNIELPTVQLLEAITLQEISDKRYFYPVAYTIDSNNVYTEIDQSDLDVLIANATAGQLQTLYYVPLNPGVVDGLIFGPRYAKLASNRTGTITYQVLYDTPSVGLVAYTGQTIEIVGVTTVQMEFVDTNLGDTGIITVNFNALSYGPIIEQITINNGESIVSNRSIIVNVLAKGTTPQVITIGQNPLLFPNTQSKHGTEAELLGNPEAGYGYTYLSFCTQGSPPCDEIVHTAFNEQTAFTLRDQQGEQCIYVRVRDFAGDGFPLVKTCVVLNTVLPFVTVNTAPSAILQSSSTYLLTGNKLPNSNIILNGIVVVQPDSLNTWSYEVMLASGANQFVFTSEDELNRVSPPTIVNINYTFVFTGVTSAVMIADGTGAWSAPLMGLISSDPNDPGQIFDIIVQTSDQFGNVATTDQTVLVAQQSLAVEITNPTIYAPIADCKPFVLFDIVNLNPLNFLGPYTVVADNNGNWTYSGVVLDPSTSIYTLSPNQTLVVSSVNQDGTEATVTVDLHVRNIQQMFIQLDGKIIAQNLQPPFSTLEKLSLGTLQDGQHTVQITAVDYLGYTSTDIESFIVDTTTPVVTILTPTVSELISTESSPILTYTINSVSPIMSKTVYIDGVNVGAIESGSPLPKLTDGLHTITVSAETIARCEMVINDGYGYGYGPEPQAHGKTGTATVIFTYLAPFVINLNTDAPLLNIGNDIDGLRQADSVIEELRILNTPSSDAEILDDWRLLYYGIPFQNAAVGDAQFTSQELQLIAQEGLNQARVSLPTQTLELMHFDTSIQSVPGIDNRPTNSNGTIQQDSNGNYIETANGLPLDLATVQNPIISGTAATNQLVITVYTHENDSIDQDLVTESINQLMPARGEALISFETVP